MLEKYIQLGRLACLLVIYARCLVGHVHFLTTGHVCIVSQVPKIAKSNLFTGFLLNAQQVTKSSSTVLNCDIHYYCVLLMDLEAPGKQGVDKGTD